MNGTQLRAMLWLRWRLTRNQWIRSSGVGAIIAMIMLIAGLCLALVGGIAGVVGGAFGLSQASPTATMHTWDVLVGVFFWTTGLITELQRSEILDFSRLLHLPISLRDVFLLNYLASHLSFSLALMLPAMLGLTVGLVLGHSAVMVLLLPLVLGFFFMVSAWTYCLRGWLAALMVNKRRRRAIVMGITMTFILLSQLPNLLTTVWFHGAYAPSPPSPAEFQKFAQRQAQEQARTAAVVDLVHCCVPFLWLPLGAKALTEGHAWPAVGGAFGLFAIGAWGLARAYRATLRFYQGGENKKLIAASKSAAAPVALATTGAGRKILVERTLPAIPDEVAALALASFRSMSRAPEVKMALGTNVMIFLILGASMLVRRTAALPDEARPFVATAAVAVALIGLAQVMSNHFGFDRGGFRTLVLLPTPRRYLLLGKNLALLPVALAVFAVYLGFAALLAHLDVADILAATVEFVAAFLALSAMGNLASILAPYRISAGSLRPTKTKGMTQLLKVVIGMLLPLALLPVFLPAGLGLLSGQLGWLPGAAVTLLFCAVLLAVVSALCYWRTLEPLGRLLQRREKAILQVVTQEVE